MIKCGVNIFVASWCSLIILIYISNNNPQCMQHIYTYRDMSGKTRERAYRAAMSPSNRTAHAHLKSAVWGGEGGEASNRMIGGLHSTETETQGPNCVFLHQRFSFKASPCPLLLLCFPTPDCSFAKICSGACVNKLAPSTFLNTHILCAQ